MATARIDDEVVQDLQRAGLLEFASDIGYLETLHPPPPRINDPGRNPSVNQAAAATIIANAGASAANAELSLMSSRRQLQHVLRPSQSKVSDATGLGSNSPNSSIKQGRKSARTAVEQSAGRAANKGLRHFAMQVCNKIEVKGRTSYNEVADELVEELKDEADAAGGDDKNIRRRVYDAFNVLLAVGIIAKEAKKDIIWKGFPTSKPPDLEEAQAEKLRRVQAVEKKQQELQELIEQHSMVKQLLEVNPVRGPEDTDMALQIPFVLVRAKPEATVEVSVSESMEEVDFKFNAPFSLHDDSFVLKQMIQHYGSIRSMQQTATGCHPGLQKPETTGETYRR